MGTNPSLDLMKSNIAASIAKGQPDYMRTAAEHYVLGSAMAPSVGALAPVAGTVSSYGSNKQTSGQVRLTKDLELTSKQQKEIRPLPQEHHDKIQALLDKNPNASRQALGPQIRAISDQTHHEIDASLTDHQKQRAKAMVERERNGEENRRPLPPASSPTGANS